MSGSNKHRHYSDKKSSTKSKIAAKVPIVLLSMILSGLLMLIIAAYFSLKTDSPLLLSTPLSLIALYLCSFIGGIICALIFQNPDSYICALFSSSLLMLISLIAKAFIKSSPSTPQNVTSVVLHALIVAACLAGVLITEKIRSQNNRRHKIRR